MVKGSTKKVLVLSEVRGDTRRYRALHLIEQLELLGVDCTSVHLSDFDIDAVFERRWDVVVFHRMAYSPHVRAILGKLMGQGTIILTDFDDLIFDTQMFAFINSPDFSDPVRARLYKATMQDIRTVLDKSEGALTSTNYLADQVKSLGKLAWVHRNAFNFEMLRYSEQAWKANKNRKDAGKRVVIGYASGTLTHNRDFDLVRPALMKILRRYPNVELRLVGPLDAGSDWGDIGERVTRQPRVPWRVLPEVLAQFDINLAPLVTDNPFSQSKSEIKYMEAAMVGIPTAASPTEAFCYAIRPGENGFLPGSLEEWEQTLSRLVEDAALREQIGEQARAQVLHDYHPATRAGQLGRLLDVICQEQRGKPFWDGDAPTAESLSEHSRNASARDAWLPAIYEKDPSLLKVGVYRLRHYGLKDVLFRAWIFLRRLVAPIFPFKRL